MGELIRGYIKQLGKLVMDVLLMLSSWVISCTVTSGHLALHYDSMEYCGFNELFHALSIFIFTNIIHISICGLPSGASGKDPSANAGA